MADFSLVKANDGGFDIAIIGDDIAVDGGLETAVLLSLFSDALVSTDELAAVDDETDRRGWWGDDLADDSNQRTGSKLWLYDRESFASIKVDRIKEAATEALQWLIDDGVAKAVTVTASTVKPKTVSLTVVIERFLGDPVTYRYSSVWPEESAQYSGTVELSTEDGLTITTEGGHRIIL